MKKILKCKRLFIIILLLVILSMTLCTVSFANSELDFNRLDNKAGIMKETNTAETLYDIFGRAIDVITIIGVGIAFVILIVIGIKYVTESVDGRAKIKESMTPYVIGVVVIIAASAILQLVDVFVSAIFYNE